MLSAREEAFRGDHRPAVKPISSAAGARLPTSTNAASCVIAGAQSCQTTSEAPARRSRNVHRTDTLGAGYATGNGAIASYRLIRPRG